MNLLITLLLSLSSLVLAQQPPAEPPKPPAVYAAIPVKPVGKEFLKMYSSEGQPKPTYTVRLTKRFAARLNKPVDSATQSEAERVKWQKIMAELQRAADRTIPSEKHWMVTTREEARKRSIAFEKTGVLAFDGAWSVATIGTASRHGFGNMPCAEFVSEVIREAYARAGYATKDDFNKAKKNELSYFGGSAMVTNLSNYLNLAGWVPWEASKFIPPAGAPMMHMSGTSPGHAYVSGGNQGRIVVDNAKPEGRDLTQTTSKLIAYMYMNGLFFLPPGINPVAWPQVQSSSSEKRLASR